VVDLAEHEVAGSGAAQSMCLAILLFSGKSVKEITLMQKRAGSTTQ
jgi:hypothetical protein